MVSFGFQSSLDRLEESFNLSEGQFVNHFASISEEPNDLGEIPEVCRQYEGLSVDELLAELHQLQENRVANRERLMQAGQRGQELVAEENMLQAQLSDHLAALADTEGGSPKNGSPLRRMDSVDSEMEFNSAPSFGGFGAAPSMAYSRSIHQTSARKKAHKQILNDQAEVDRLRGLNESIGEQIEEKEMALLRKRNEKENGGDDGDGTCDVIDDETRHRLNAVHLDLQEATSNARHAETVREREIAEVERELLDMRRQSSSMMAVVTKRLEATRQRNMRLKEELEAQSASVVDPSPLYESIQKLRHELEAYQNQGDEMDTELREARQEVAAAEDDHFEARAEAIEAKIEAKHRASMAHFGAKTTTPHRLALGQVLPLSHHASTTASEDSDGSEVWHCGECGSEKVDETQLNMVSKATARRQQKNKLRQRQLNRHLHKDMEVVVNTTQQDDVTSPSSRTVKKGGEKTTNEKPEKNGNGWGTWTSYFGTAAADFYNRNVTESW